MSSLYCNRSFEGCGKKDVRIRQQIEKASIQVVMSLMLRLGFLDIEVSTRRPSNKSSGSADVTDEGSRSPKSANFPATTCPTVYAGTGVKPGPTMKGWLKTGNDVADERLASCSGRVYETLSWDNKGGMLAMDNECEGVGGKKIGGWVHDRRSALDW